MRRTPGFFLAVLLTVPLAAHAVSSPWKSNPHGRVRLIAPYVTAPERGVIFVGVQFESIRGWHVYWKNPGDAGFPPKIDWTGSRGVRNPEILWPAPKRLSLPGGLTALGYEKGVVYPVRMERTPGALHLQADIRYLTCGTACVPHREILSLDMPSGAHEEADPDDATLLAEAMAQVPLAIEQVSDVRLNARVIATAKGELFEAVVEPIRPVKARRLDIFFDAEKDLQFGRPMVQWLPGGLYRLTVPVTSSGPAAFRQVTLNYVLTGLVRDRRPLAVEESKAFNLLLLPSTEPAPMPASSRPILWFFGLALLGGLILNIMPCVLPVLSIKLFSLLEQSGDSRFIIARNALASTAGIEASFLALAGAAILAKQAGYAVGWGVQFQEPVFVALLFLIVGLFALNLWDLFEFSLPTAVNRWGRWTQQEGFLGYFFSGLLATLLATPCSAPFLGTAVGFALAQPTGVILVMFLAVGTGMALPYLILAAFPSALSLLPRPGAWMQRVRFLLGGLLAGTAGWLGYVLAGEVTLRGQAIFYGISAAMAVLVIARHRARLRAKPPLVSAVLAVLLLGFGIAAINVVDRSRSASVGELRAPQKSRLAWQPFNEAEITRLVKQGRMVFVDVSADWCFTCKVNEATVLETSTVAEAFARKNIVLMKADWTNRNERIARYMQAFGRYGIPFYIVYAPGKAPRLLSELLTKRKVLEALKD